jgi:hypothetical protein
MPGIGRCGVMMKLCSRCDVWFGRAAIEAKLGTSIPSTFLPGVPVRTWQPAHARSAISCPRAIDAVWE